MSQSVINKHIHLGGEGELIHFSHANGFPPMAYKAFLEPFTGSHEVIASLHRPLWHDDPESMKSWQVFGDDLLNLISQQKSPVISVGHSMGATAILMAACKKPELFESVVLIEPVLVPWKYLLAMRFFNRFSRESIPLVRKTLNRVDQWPDHQECFDHFRSKAVFKNIDDEVLWDYVLHGVEHTDQGNIRLSYSREWEARCYSSVFNLWTLLPQITVPVLAIRGTESNTIFPAAWDKWRSRSPHHDFVDIEGAGHLIPLEQPEQLGDVVRDWLS
jgi:pimeloyl-ACP methyl ester carboxylesterase